MLTEDEVMGRLREKVDGYRTKGEAAAHMGLPQTNLSEILRGKRPMPNQVLEALGLERVTLYKEKTSA